MSIPKGMTAALIHLISISLMQPNFFFNFRPYFLKMLAGLGCLFSTQVVKFKYLFRKLRIFLMFVYYLSLTND